MKHKNNKPTFYDYTKQNEQDEIMDRLDNIETLLMLAISGSKA